MSRSCDQLKEEENDVSALMRVKFIHALATTDTPLVYHPEKHQGGQYLVQICEEEKVLPGQDAA